MISLTYAIYLSAEAAKILSRLEKEVELRIKKRLKDVAINPDRHVKRLTGHTLYSLRVGSYRVILSIDREAHTIFVVTVGHRSTVYDRTR